MDKAAAIKMLAGTVTRGMLWGLGLLCQWTGYQMDSDEWVTGAGLFVAGTGVELFASWWSKRKDKKLLAQEPPK